MSSESAARGKQHRATGDGAHAVLGEQTGDSLRRGATIDEHDIRRHRVRRSAAERYVGLVQHAKPRAHVHANSRGSLTPVSGTNGHGVYRSARPRDASVAGAGVTVVPRGHDREHVEVGRTGDRARERAVGERGVRLDHPDERDSRRVEDIAVVVRIDRSLEPGENLIGSRVDAVAALRVRLPTADADRQDRRSRRDSVQAVRALGTGDDPGELGRMSLGSSRNRRMRLRDSAAARRDHVDA